MITMGKTCGCETHLACAQAVDACSGGGDGPLSFERLLSTVLPRISLTAGSSATGGERLALICSNPSISEDLHQQH